MIPLKDNLSGKAFPWVTLILIALNSIAFLGQLLLPKSSLRGFYANWAVVPANISEAFASHNPAHIGLALVTVVTAMFLHSGWLHLLGNMIFLQACGPAVESRFGSLKFAAFYILGGFGACGMQMFMDDAHSTIPMLGASGAIAAVLGAYLLFFPKARFTTLILPYVFPIPVIVSAFFLLIGWISVQLISGFANLTSLQTGGGVAYWCHVGGFIVGLIAAGLWALYRPISHLSYESSCTCKCQECRQTKSPVKSPSNFRFWKKIRARS